MTERVAIVGSREHPNLDLVREYVRGLPKGTVVISGGADGVDKAAAEVAWDRELELIEYTVEPCGLQLSRLAVIFSRNRGRHDRPAWEFHVGEQWRTALLFRNTCIAGDCTRMVAFVDGSKGGTWDAIAQAKRFKRPVKIVRAIEEVRR